ncbi:MAG: hypothetical protein EAY76_05335 [Alphaproteobacteria bacterium]|nr:MAG: hypothetical protein EAY76_05335 [Alphaproteobacteria bacterium]
MKKQVYNRYFIPTMLILSSCIPNIAYSAECIIARSYHAKNNAMLHFSRAPLDDAEAATNEQSCAKECRRHAYYITQRDATILEKKTGTEKVEISCSYGSDSGGRVVAQFHTNNPESLTVRDQPRPKKPSQNASQNQNNSVIAPLHEPAIARQPVQARISPPSSPPPSNHIYADEDALDVYEDNQDYEYDHDHDDYDDQDYEDDYHDYPDEHNARTQQSPNTNNQPPYRNMPTTFRPLPPRQ